jgi:three-Cys-motif partner protein
MAFLAMLDALEAIPEMNPNTRFFGETREHSIIKAKIVSHYFWAWANVIIPTVKKNGHSRIAYIDLFAGPGRYKDGTKSTPLMVLEKVIQDPAMREMLVTIFNDKNQDHSFSLQQEINTLPGIQSLKYQPKIYNYEVGTEIVALFSQMRLIPTLFFVDPWGYKGLTLQLINSVLKNWGCDAIIFFNYNRISMGLSNSAVQSHMNALFTEGRAARLRQRLDGLPPSERELAIIEEIANALTQFGAKYVLPFCFKNEYGTRTSHHLIFVTKHFRGYEIMKDIMAGQSSTADQGVPSFTYNPADERFPVLFELTRPLDQLESMLLNDFAGRSLSLRALYEEHSVGKPYILRNYQEILRNLENIGKIAIDPPAERRQKRSGKVTLGERVVLTFPGSR